MKHSMKTEMRFWLFEHQKQEDEKMTHSFSRAADKSVQVSHREPDIKATRPAPEKKM